MEKKSKNSIIIGISVLLLVTLTLLGLTYAYYRTRIVGNPNDESISVTSKLLELTYDDGNGFIDAGDIVPGDTIIKTFSVENTGDETIEYGVYLENVINEFVNTSDLLVELTCKEVDVDSEEVVGNCKGLTNYQYPLTNTELVINTIDADKKHEYSLTVEYILTNEDQTADMGMIISGNIKVYATTDITTLYVNADRLAETDVVELHSNPKTANYYNGVYKFVGVELGKHTLIVKDKDGNKKGETSITIQKGDDQSSSGNIININNKTTEIRMSISSIENSVINLGEIYQQGYGIKVGDVEYKTEQFAEAIEASSKENPAKLTSDIVLIENQIIDITNKDMYLDLNGYQLSGEMDCTNIINVKGYNTTLTISNGEIITKNDVTAVTLGTRKETNEQNIRVIIKDDVTMNVNSFGVVVYGNKAILDFYGQMYVNASGIGISSNGYDAGIEINIYEGSLISAEAEGGRAIYLPAMGVTNINGGTIIANSPIAMKSGTLNINAGTITATGKKKTFGSTCETIISGISSTGDVIFVELNDNYNKQIVININSVAKLVSQNENIIRTYMCYVSDVNAEENKVTITGPYTTGIVDSNNSLITTYN